MFELVPYRETWIKEFQTIANPVREALGDLAMAIHHIGSTAVPGMPSKDVIDIQLTVHDLNDPIRTPLETLGYQLATYTQDHAPWGLEVSERDMEKRYYRGPIGRKVHLHVRTPDRLNQRYALLCRDFLRSHPMAAQSYAEIKRQLVKRFSEDEGSYYDIKDPVFDLIVCGGFEWAQRTGWAIPPTDA